MTTEEKKNERHIAGAAFDDAHYRYRVPRCRITCLGSGNGKRTRICNLAEVCKAYCVSARTLTVGSLLKLLAKSLQCSVSDQAHAEITGHHSVKAIDDVLATFERRILSCPSPKCHYPELGKYRRKDATTLHAVCRACGFKATLVADAAYGAFCPKVKPTPKPKQMAEAKVDDGGGQKAALDDDVWSLDTSEEAVAQRRKLEFESSS